MRKRTNRTQGHWFYFEVKGVKLIFNFEKINLIVQFFHFKIKNRYFLKFILHCYLIVFIFTLIISKNKRINHLGRSFYEMENKKKKF